MKTKKCSKCKQVKSLNEFSKDKNRKDGHQYWCKECINEYCKQIRKKPMKLNNCKVCGKGFTPYSNMQKYCSKKCYKIIRKAKRRKEWCRKYQRQRRKTDINFRIACNLRTRVWKVLKSNYKSAHTIELLGCSIEYLKKDLQKLFKKGMNWENYGTYWEIDHIRPCCSFDLSKTEEQKKCFYYTNLQPLTIKENRIKNRRYENGKV